jgi:serine/threonine-protein kinase RsbW
MAQRSSTWTMDRQFSTDTKAAKQILDELLSNLSGHKWTEEDVFGVHLAVEEALMNAIKHGNRNDANKQVRVKAEVSDISFRIEITDEGRGFKPEEVPDPTLDENLDLPSGRGLMLMRSFMSQVEYNTQGNQVTMVKHRSGARVPD